MDPDRFELLLQRHLDQVLTRDEHVEFERMLLASPKARAAFWQGAQSHALLRQWGEGEWGREEEPEPTRRSRLRPFSSRWARGSPYLRVRLRHLYLTAGAAAALVALAAWILWKASAPATVSPLLGFGNDGREPAPPVASKGMAVLTRTFDEEWAEPGMARYAGEGLAPGRLRLNAGAVQIEFTHGARVVVEAPADFELATENEVVLTRGRLRAYVPESAHGFVVRSPNFSLVDHGTEFGCVLLESGEAEVHVFGGELDLRLHREAPAVRVLHANEAVRLADGRIVALPVRREAFLDDEELARREQAQARRQLAAWRESSRLLNQHPHLLAHLDFEAGGSGARTLTNHAIHAPPGSGASLVGCDWVEGRWPGKGAVEFKHGNDRLWLNVPGTFEAVTFLAWVRVDSLPYFLHALLTAEGPGGKINWCLKDNGALSFGIQVPHDGRGRLIHRSTARIRPEQLGSWLCLATVYGSDGTVTHYLNGEPAGAGRLGERKPCKLGNCEIGNSAATAQKGSAAGSSRQANLAEPPKHFHGWMDEFAIFSVALTAEEIGRLHTQGRSGRAALLP